jgi:hypothetical protein
VADTAKMDVRVFQQLGQSRSELMVWILQNRARAEWIIFPDKIAVRTVYIGLYLVILHVALNLFYFDGNMSRRVNVLNAILYFCLKRYKFITTPFWPSASHNWVGRYRSIDTKLDYQDIRWRAYVLFVTDITNGYRISSKHNSAVFILQYFVRESYGIMIRTTSNFSVCNTWKQYSINCGAIIIPHGKFNCFKVKLLYLLKHSSNRGRRWINYMHLIHLFLLWFLLSLAQII